MWDPKRIADPEWFLDRADERRRLADLVAARDNVLVYGQRRLGKTSLIRRVAADLPDFAFIEVDCLFAASEDQLSEKLLGAIRATRLAKSRQFLDWAKAATKDLEISIDVSADGVTPNLRRGHARARPLDDTLAFITRVSRSAKTPVVLVLDEFQAVMSESKGTIAKIRGHAQNQKDVSYIVAGSQPSILIGLVRHKSPFWRQLTEFRVGPIDVETALDDVERLSAAAVPSPSRAAILDVTRGNTQRLAEILETAWSADQSFSLAAISSAVGTVLGRHAASFERMATLLTAYQRKLAIALATDEPEHPMGHAFIARHELRGPAHVSKATGALRKAEILDEDGEFIDPLFALWLRRGGTPPPDLVPPPRAPRRR